MHFHRHCLDRLQLCISIYCRHYDQSSSSSALSSQHPQTLRFFPREVKNIKHDRLFSSRPREVKSSRKICRHARQLAQQHSLMCSRLNQCPNIHVKTHKLLQVCKQIVTNLFTSCRQVVFALLVPSCCNKFGTSC